MTDMCYTLCAGEITRVFGKPMLDYALRLASGHTDYLPRLPNKLIVRIAEFLELVDICKFAQTCKQFNEVRFCFVITKLPDLVNTKLTYL